MSQTTSIPWTIGLIPLFVSGLFGSAPESAEGDRIMYPRTHRIDHVDEYHGTKVPDPYRWLEQDVRESKEVAAWVAAQNKVTLAYLESIPERNAINRRLTK